MSVKKAKRALRKEIKGLKALLSEEKRQTKSLELFHKLEREEWFVSADTLFCFWSMDDEIYTPDFINRWYKSKTILLPCVKGDELELRVYEGENSMVAGEQFGIPEPVGTLFDISGKIDVALIPGVAFDRDMNRMGRGRGFYDRILSSLRGRALLAGICYDFQVTDSVPVEEHDIKMDILITD